MSLKVLASVKRIDSWPWQPKFALHASRSIKVKGTAIVPSATPTDTERNTANMESSKPSSALFDVYLRLRPSHTDNERFLHVEHDGDTPTNITIKPPSNDKRKRAVEQFKFTRVFEEDAGQRDLFDAISIVPTLQGVLGEAGKPGRDGLLATLGVTGSGKVGRSR